MPQKRSKQKLILNLEFKTEAMLRLIDTAPYLARCSNNKTAVFIRPRKYAINWPYMQINRSDMISWLIFDLDHDNPNIWDEKNLPPPNFIVRDKSKNTSHLYYAIVPVCISNKANISPIVFMKKIYKAMGKSLNADSDYSGIIAKTPYHEQWATTEYHSHIYELGELADFVNIDNATYWKDERKKDTSHSRNCMLFNELRIFAYRIVNHARKYSDFESFKDTLKIHADNYNNFEIRGFDSNLPYCEIQATVKSVAKWTWDNYKFNDCLNRGIMKLESSLSKKEKQSLAAKRTHIERVTNTINKIKKAVNILKKDKRKITYTAIAEMCGLTRQTISCYKKHICEFLRREQIISLSAIFHGFNFVRYAVSGNYFFLYTFCVLCFLGDLSLFSDTS